MLVEASERLQIIKKYRAIRPQDDSFSLLSLVESLKSLSLFCKFDRLIMFIFNSTLMDFRTVLQRHILPSSTVTYTYHFAAKTI